MRQGTADDLSRVRYSACVDLLTPQNTPSAASSQASDTKKPFFPKIWAARAKSSVSCKDSNDFVSASIVRKPLQQMKDTLPLKMLADPKTPIEIYTKKCQKAVRKHYKLMSTSMDLLRSVADAKRDLLELAHALARYGLPVGVFPSETSSASLTSGPGETEYSTVLSRLQGCQSNLEVYISKLKTHKLKIEFLQENEKAEEIGKMIASLELALKWTTKWPQDKDYKLIAEGRMKSARRRRKEQEKYQAQLDQLEFDVNTMLTLGSVVVDTADTPIHPSATYHEAM